MVGAWHPRFGGVTRRRFLQIGGAVTLGAAVTACFGARRGPGPKKGHVTAVPANIAGDFSRDVTAELTAWIAAQPDGTTIEVPAGARYRIDGPVRVLNKQGLTFTCPAGIVPVFSGAGVVYDESRTDFTRDERARCQWFLDGCEDILFHRIRAEGSNRAYRYLVGLEGQAAWWIAGCNRVELSACEAEWTYGDFVQVQGGTIKDVGHPPAEDIWVHDCASRHIGRIVFVGNNVRRAVFERNRCFENQRSFFDAEPNFLDQIVEDVYIQDNVIGPKVGGVHFEISGGQPTDVPIQRLVGQRNTFVGASASVNFGLPRGTYPTSFPRRQHFYWVENMSDTATSFPTALTLKEADFCLIRGNVQPLGWGRAYLATIRSCAVNSDRPVDGTFEPCNVTPEPSPAPTSVPEIPAVWPFPRS